MRAENCRRWLYLILAVLLIVAYIPTAAFAADAGYGENPFSDVFETDFFYNSVLWAANQGITNGYGNAGTFQPDFTCTRAQVTTFLWRAAGCPEPEAGVNPFVDISETNYFYKAVLWASENEITNGYGSETVFMPDLPCTRGQIVTFLWRAQGQPGTVDGTVSFTDVKEGLYYYDAVLWAYENKIAEGYDSAVFDPNGECTRGQAVTFLWRAAESDVNAVHHGLSTTNAGKQNSEILQKLIDDLSQRGGTIYIPAGVYEFAENGTQAIGSHCIKMKSNVRIVGDGDSTILKPVGESGYGMDMFYFNDYLDTGAAVYLENCAFENFVIDASETSCKTYTTAGKGFMINLFRNCHWKNVTVKNTDATGFGVDCPIDSSITDCVAIGCGKAATTANGGASGFGIGFGYREDESFTITNCQAYGNRKFGFFFEHQGRFNAKRYTAACADEFVVSDCTAAGNYYNFGGIAAMDTVYENCTSGSALQHGFFFENSVNCKAVNCYSENEADTAFVIVQSGTDGGKYEVKNVSYEQCTSCGSQFGAKVVSYGSAQLMTDNAILNCTFEAPEQCAVYTSGIMDGLTLKGNSSDMEVTVLDAQVGSLVNEGNSWNESAQDLEEAAYECTG